MKCSTGDPGRTYFGLRPFPASTLLPKLIGDFKKKPPFFCHLPQDRRYQGSHPNVLQDQVEFGIIGAKLNHPSLHYEKYEEDQIVVVAPSEHPLTRKKKYPSVSFEGTLDHPEEGSGTRIAVERALRRKGRTLKQFNVVIEMGSTSSVKRG